MQPPAGPGCSRGRKRPHLPQHWTPHAVATCTPWAAHRGPWVPPHTNLGPWLGTGTGTEAARPGWYAGVDTSTQNRRPAVTGTGLRRARAGGQPSRMRMRVRTQARPSLPVLASLRTRRCWTGAHVHRNADTRRHEHSRVHLSVHPDPARRGHTQAPETHMGSSSNADATGSTSAHGLNTRACPSVHTASHSHGHSGIRGTHGSFCHPHTRAVYVYAFIRLSPLFLSLQLRSTI